MTERIPIQVGATHIENGWRLHRRMCPIALALRDGYCKGWATVDVNSNGNVFLVWDHQALSSSWRLSPEALTFLTLFDTGQMIAAAMCAARGGLYIERVGVA